MKLDNRNGKGAVASRAEAQNYFYESDVSDCGTAIGSEIILSDGSCMSPVRSLGKVKEDKESPFSSTLYHRDREYRDQPQSSSSAESLTGHLYFTPGKRDKSIGNEGKAALLLAGEKENGTIGNGRNDGNVEEGNMMDITMNSPRDNEMTPKKKKVDVNILRGNPRKKQHLYRSQNPVKKFQASASLLVQKQQQQQQHAPQKYIYSKATARCANGSGPQKRKVDFRNHHNKRIHLALSTHGIQKVAQLAVKKRITPVENLLSSISESLRAHVTNVVKKEIQDAFGELRIYLDAKLSSLSVPVKQKTRTQGQQQKSRQRITKRCQKVNNGTGREAQTDQTVNNSPNIKKDSTPVKTSPSSTEDHSNRKIVWANKRVRSETLVEKLKKYMEMESNDMDLESSMLSSSSWSSGVCCDTPPNSPASFHRPAVPSPPLFTLGLVKLEPVEDTEVEATTTENEVLESVGACTEENTTTDNGLLGRLTPLAPINNAVNRRSNRGVARKLKDPITCHICGKTFLNNSSLNQHVSFHLPERPYKCRNCDKCYKTTSELNRHLIVHATGQNKAHECIYCCKRFLRKQYLKTHLIRHGGNLTWKCTYPQCVKTFVSEEDLKKHERSYHKKKGI